MIVGLDIGAGNKSFAKNLVKNNYNLDILMFCGEPNWNNIYNFNFFKIYSQNEADILIKKKKKE